MRGDLIEVYKMMHGFTNIDISEFFILLTTGLRGHNYKLFKPRINTDVGKYSFSYRVVDAWNARSFDVVNASNIKSFKNLIGKQLLKWGSI